MFADVNLLVQFANLENKMGEWERAQTLYENILSSYPKRVDVWSCYVDCVIKSKNIDLTRCDKFYNIFYYEYSVRLHSTHPSFRLSIINFTFAGRYWSAHAPKRYRRER